LKGIIGYRSGNPDSSKEDIMTTKKTRENLNLAFAGEAKAYFRLLAFAEKADEEGYAQIARLFRAVALAESVHAGNHFAFLEKVGTTEENVKISFEKETFVNEVAYPAYLKQAWADKDDNAIWTFTKARNAEERHAKLYKRALSEMASDRESVYHVCSYCGWIEEDKAPDACPNCQRPPDSYREVK
jgi:rubrerythrin